MATVREDLVSQVTAGKCRVRESEPADGQPEHHGDILFPEGLDNTTLRNLASSIAAQAVYSEPAVLEAARAR